MDRIKMNKIATATLYGSLGVILSARLYSKVTKDDKVAEIVDIIAIPTGMTAVGYIVGALNNTPDDKFLYE